jgi:UDP-N-acetylmuramyl pentapeptide synthase
MLPFTLDQLHAAIGGQLSLPGELACRLAQEPLGQVVTDSRQVRPSDVFWALPGVLREGSEFVKDAIARGASGVVTYGSRTVGGFLRNPLRFSEKPA